MTGAEELRDLAGRLDPSASFDERAFLESLTTPQLRAWVDRIEALEEADQGRVILIREPAHWCLMLDDRVLLDSAEELEG